MNIYIIIFIIIIPIAIFLNVVLSDINFTKRFQEIKAYFNKNFISKIGLNQSPQTTKQIYELTDGIGFGFGKEYFTCEAPPKSLSEKQRCDLKNTAIGIKFHKFKMRHNYTVPELDNIVINDYCSKEFLDNNVVNIINNIWNESRVKFYLNDIVEEDEINNLVTYYTTTPEENAVFPSCKNIVNFRRNPIQFSQNGIPPPRVTTQSTATTQVGMTLPASAPYDAGDINSLFSLKEEPPYEPTFLTSIPDGFGNITHDEKVQMTKTDIEILKTILAKDNALQNSENKEIIRNIFFRMTDETKYNNDNDLHIYLLPYIEDEVAFIVEGRNNRPLIVMSMYYLDCKKVKRVFEKTYTEHTKGLWMPKLVGNYKLMKNYETQYNEIAQIDIVDNPNNANASGIYDPILIKKTKDDLNNLRKEEHELMNKVKKFKLDNANIDDIKLNIERNTNRLKEIYDYDYDNDHSIKMLKKFKGKSGPLTIIENGKSKVKTVGYNTMKEYKIKEIKDNQKKQIKRLQTELSIDKKALTKFETQVKLLELPLTDIREKIRKIIDPHKGTKNVEILLKLKENIDKMKKEISTPMYYADKVRRIININLLIVSLLGVNIVKSSEIKLYDLNIRVSISQLLIKNISDGGIKSTSNIREIISSNKMNHSYLVINTLSSSLNEKNIITGPSEDKNQLYKDCNKCKVLISNSEKSQLCEKSKYYETARLNALDLNAQFYYTSELLKKHKNGDLKLSQKEVNKLETFYKELENKCIDYLGEDYNNYRAEPEYIKNTEYKSSPISNGFFSNEEAIKNYEWLSRFLFDNQIKIDDDFIFKGVDYLNKNSEVFNEELKNTIFPPNEIQPTDPISCPFPINNEIIDTNINLTSLNDYILKKHNCNNNYMGSFDESYI